MDRAVEHHQAGERGGDPARALEIGRLVGDWDVLRQVIALPLACVVLPRLAGPWRTVGRWAEPVVQALLSFQVESEDKLAFFLGPALACEVLPTLEKDLMFAESLQVVVAESDRDQADGDDRLLAITDEMRELVVADVLAAEEGGADEE